MLVIFVHTSFIPYIGAAFFTMNFAEVILFRPVLIRRSIVTNFVSFPYFAVVHYKLTPTPCFRFSFKSTLLTFFNTSLIFVTLVTIVVPDYFIARLVTFTHKESCSVLCSLSVSAFRNISSTCAVDRTLKPNTLGVTGNVAYKTV